MNKSDYNGVYEELVELLGLENTLKIQLYRVKCTKIKNLLKYITYRYYQGVYVIFFTICYIFIN